jgi:hypothetical protein
MELGVVLMNSPQAKELIRQAFGIPDMPAPEVASVIEEKNKARRKKKSQLEMDTES